MMTQDSTGPNSDNQPQAPEKVTCPGNRESVVRYFIMTAIFLGFSAWCIYDWQNYPKPDAPFGSDTINEYFGWAFNHFLPFILIPLGLITAAKGIKTLKTQVVADQEGIAVGATRIPWSGVERLDASQLPKKQILDLYHGGKRLRLHGMNLVNWKPLVALIDRKVPDEKKTTTQA
jgi:hypothetical protein